MPRRLGVSDVEALHSLIAGATPIGPAEPLANALPHYLKWTTLLSCSGLVVPPVDPRQPVPFSFPATRFFRHVSLHAHGFSALTILILVANRLHLGELRGPRPPGPDHWWATPPVFTGTFTCDAAPDMRQPPRTVRPGGRGKRACSWM